MRSNQNNQLIGQLTGQSEKIDIDTQKKLISFLFDRFIQHPQSLLHIGDGQINQVPTKKAFLTMSKLAIKREFKGIELLTLNKEKNIYKWNIRIDDIYDIITTMHSCKMIRYTSNLFSLNPQINLQPLTETVEVTLNKLHIKSISKKSIKEDEYKEIVRDYKHHFKHFDKLLNLIVDMRFAKDKKASFVHLRVKSDWGKSFLSGLLQNLEIAIEVDYHNLMNKSTNDIRPIQVRNSFVMILDEFNNFSQEMKKLSHSITLAAKFEMSERVELYLKILMSAEKSPSFTGGVDDQIVNRVMVFDMPDHETTTLISRPIYKKYGNAKYMRALEYYSYLSLKQRIDTYLSMAELEAYKRADDAVRRTYNENKMIGIENVNATIANILNEEIEDIAYTDIDAVASAYRQIKRNITVLEEGKYAGNIFIRSTHKVFETIIKNATIETEYKKMKFKLSGINEHLDIVSDHTKIPIKLFGKSYKGIVIKTRKIEPIPVEIDQPDGTIKNHNLDRINGVLEVEKADN